MSDRNKHLFVGKPVRNLDGAEIRIGHAQVFGLAAGKPAKKMSVAEQAGGRVTPKLLCHLSVRIGSLAAREQLPPAEEAVAAGDSERNHDAIADLELGVFRSDLDNLAHGLVTQDVAGLHSRHHAVIDVQIGTADRTGRNLDDRVAGMLDLRVRYAFAADVLFSVPGQCAHAIGLLSMPANR